MRNTGALAGDVDDAVDVYFRQCAIRVTAADIAMMAATLASRGVNPVTGEEVVDEPVASHVLTVMATCGMYNYSGSWLVHVGLPAKSGVSGALVAASLGEFGIGLFSPLLDEHGNSVRGIAACKELATRFELQLFRRPGKPAPAMYAVDLENFSHGWIGWEGEHDAQRELPADVVIRGLQGDVSFSDAEALLRSFDHYMDAEESMSPQRIVLDLHRVGGISRAATGILSALVVDLKREGHLVGIVDIPGRHLIEATHVFTSLELALRSLE
jgi:glutaminase